MKAAIAIPARHASTRFPGKPLTQILGRSLVQRVWGQCVKALPEEQVYVATDSPLIVEHCAAHGMRVLFTSSDCLTGTDRVCEASRQIDADIYVNVQGDEP